MSNSASRVARTPTDCPIDEDDRYDDPIQSMLAVLKTFEKEKNDLHDLFLLGPPISCRAGYTYPDFVSGTLRMRVKIQHQNLFEFMDVQCSADSLLELPDQLEKAYQGLIHKWNHPEEAPRDDLL
jgi:hypothetical protein